VNRRRTVALVALVLGATAALAWARPGGGDSYSGGGGHGGGGSGGSGGSGDAAVLFELIYQLLRLCFHYPKIGLPIVAILIGAWIWGAWVKHKNKDWLSGPPVELAKPIATADDLRRLDPDFSMIVFEDFVYRLYATAHGARGRRGALDALAPYLGPAARAALASRPPTDQPVTGVVVGAMRTFDVWVPTPDQLAAAGRSAVPHRRRVRGQLHRRHQQAVRGRALAPASSRDRADQAAERGPDLHLPELRRAVGHRRRRRRPALRVVRRGRRQRPLRLGGRGHRAAPRAQQPARPDRRGAGARHVLADLPRRPGRRRLAAPDRRRSGDRRDLALGPPASRLPGGQRCLDRGRRRRHPHRHHRRHGRLPVVLARRLPGRRPAERPRGHAHHPPGPGQDHPRPLLRRDHDPDLGHRQGLRRGEPTAATSAAAATASARTPSTGRSCAAPLAAGRRGPTARAATAARR
jgi:hypothetical protein